MTDATAVEPSGVSTTTQARLKLALTLCPLCGEDRAEPVAVGNDLSHGTTADSFLALRCRECELVYLSPRPVAEERPRLYPPSYFARLLSGSHQRDEVPPAIARWTVRHHRSLPSHARLLEVGYGASLHLEELHQAGTRTWVWEAVTPHEDLAQSVRQAGFMVHPAPAQALGNVGATYDGVLLFLALEHCEAPLQELLSLSGLLGAGGRLVIVTQNADSAVGRLFAGRHWAGYDFPRHLSLFRPRTLRRLAARAGLEVERLGTIRNSDVWLRSTANLLLDWNAPWWLRRHAEPGSLVLGTLAALVEAVSHLRGKGALLEAVLRKPENTKR
jgi:hypothetical protein